MRTHHHRLLALGTALALVALAAPARAAVPTLLDDPEAVERMRAAPTALAFTDDDLLLAGPDLPPARVDPTGMRLPLVERPATAIALSPAGVLLAAADGRLDAFTPDGRPLWSAALPGEPTALVAGADGRALVLAGDRVAVVADHGLVERTWSLGPGEWTSLAYDAGRGLVFAGGAVVALGCGDPVAVARVVATDLAGAPAWQAYGEPHTRAAWRRCDALAPTRVVSLALAGDALLLAAEVERGGGDLFRSLPNGTAARLAVFDAASDPDSAGAGAFAFYARLDAGSGTHALGQYLLPPPGAAELRPQAIAADRFGYVYLAGLVRSLPREDDAPPLADGALAFVQAVTPDLSARPMYWTFAASDDAATAHVRLAVAAGRAVALATADDGNSAAVEWTTALDLGNAVGWVGKKEDRPDPDTMELFGYESSASASGDDCFCSAEPRPLSAISILGVLFVAGLRRRPRSRTRAVAATLVPCLALAPPVARAEPPAGEPVQAVPTPAQAQEPAALAEARRQIAAGDDEAALRSLSDALALQPDAGAYRLRADVAGRLARKYRPGAAFHARRADDLEHALALSPETAVDPAQLRQIQDAQADAVKAAKQEDRRRRMQPAAMVLGVFGGGMTIFTGVLLVLANTNVGHPPTVKLMNQGYGSLFGVGLALLGTAITLGVVSRRQYRRDQQARELFEPSYARRFAPRLAAGGLVFHF